MKNHQSAVTPPSVDVWMKEAKASPDAPRIGMYLVHNGVVREDARARVREGDSGAQRVRGMCFSHDPEKVRLAVEQALASPGIYYARVWLNQGRLAVGDDLMLVLVGGDIRPNVIRTLESLVDTLKRECVLEQELF